MSENEEQPTAPAAGRRGFAGYPHLLMTLWVMLGVSAVLGALLRLPEAAITVLWGLIGVWRLRTPSRWVRLWVLLGALGHVIWGVLALAWRVLLQHRGEPMEGLGALLLPIHAMVLVVLGAYVFCQMILPAVVRELDRRLALARGRTTEEEEKQLTPAQKRELERKRAADSLAETIESIIVAFVLAFLFRAFVVEAFVIPTGSMASTLMGEHCRYESPTGYDFEVGVSKGKRGEVICPFTRQKLTGDEAQRPYDAGDRILVEKFSVQFGNLGRWTVIVFRNPLFPHDAPFEIRKEFGENFIKRLIGLPGETIMILDGDVYAVAPEHVPQGTTLSAEQLAELVMTEGRICRKIVENPKAQDELWMPVFSSTYWLDAWGKGDTDARAGAEDDHRWIRMARDAYDAGWDQQPHRWRCNRPTFLYTGFGDADKKLRQIRYVHLHQRQTSLSTAKDRTVRLAARRRLMRQAEAFIDDFYAYNGRNGGNMVSDLLLAADVDFRKADREGRIEFTLTKYDMWFTAVLYADGRWELKRGTWSGLDADTHAGEVIDEGNAGRLKATTHIEFANVDYYLSFRIDGKSVYADASPRMPLETPEKPETREKIEKTMRQLSQWTDRREWDDRRQGSEWPHFGTSTQKSNKDRWPRVIVGAANVDLQVRNLHIFRDVYYTNAWRVGNTTAEYPYATTDRPLQLRADDYFVMGDNSPESSDGRLWAVAWNADYPRPTGGTGAWRYLASRKPTPLDEVPSSEIEDDQIYLTHLPPKGRYTPGTVPRSYLIGRAFFVYWPSGGRPFGSPLPIVPQVQRMRMIR